MSENLPTVYFVKDITSENLIRIYEKLGREATGKVAVKLSSGEPGGHHFLNPQLIKDFVNKVHGTIVECNTAYGGKRDHTEDHLQACKAHGFTDIAPVDIMDAEGEVELPVKHSNHLKCDYVGKNFLNYDFVVVLSHFKGHVMGGLGGALKNISIGIASSGGKAYIHSGGKSKTINFATHENIAEQDDFLESMAEAAEAVVNHCGDKILYINVANNLSVDCDCDSNPAPPKMADLGIFASLDPVAVDQACVDAVYNSEDPGKADLIERIESRHGIHTIDTAEKFGLGSKKYNLVTI